MKSAILPSVPPGSSCAFCAVAGGAGQDDPVATAGREVVRIVAAIARAEDERDELRDGPAAVQMDERIHHLHDLLETTEMAGSQGRARTLEGAMFQVMLVASEMRVLAECAAPERAAEAQAGMRRMERCLYSVLDVLRSYSGVDPARLGGRHYMPGELDPHADLDQALAAE